MDKRYHADPNRLQALTTQLDASKASLHSIIEHSPDAFLVIDDRGSIQFVNPAAIRLFGVDQGRLIGKHFGFPLTAGETTDIDIVNPQAGGLVAEMRVVRMDWEGEEAHVAVLRDVTERKHAQQALLASERRLAMALKASGSAAWEMDVATATLLPVDDFLFTMLGYSPGELMTASEWMSRIHDEDLPGVPEMIGDVIAGRRESYWAELRLRAKDGRWRWILSQAIAAERDIHGRAIRLIGTHTDINDRKMAEAELSVQRQRFAGIVESAMDAIITIDTGHRIVLFNAAAEAMFACPAAEALGDSIYRFIPERFRAVHTGHIECFGATGTTSRAMGKLGAVYGLRSDGVEFPIEAAISKIEVAGEKLYTVILRDISARLAAEQEIRRFNTELEELIDTRTAELKDANTALEGYASAIAHDLRAPLRAINGFSQILAERYADRLDEDGRQYLDKVLAGGQRMGDLIDGLLDLANSSRGELVRRPVDLSALARRILAEFTAAEPQRRVRCEIDEGIAAEGDPRLLEALMRNLLGNAWKYTGQRAEALIRFHADCKNHPARYCVSDNGAGFDMAHAGQLFQPFRRLHSQSRFPGIGIGLATVQRIVRRHGGEITAQAIPDAGASFCFTLSGGGMACPPQAARG